MCIQLSIDQSSAFALFCGSISTRPYASVTGSFVSALQIAVRVAHQPDVRRLADEHAAVEHLDRARHHE